MRRIEALCGVAIATSLVFGGATTKGSVSDVIVQLAVLPLLTTLGPNLRTLLEGRPKIAIFLALMVAAPILQLAPLPPQIWSMLPGRSAVVETYQSAGIQLPWLAITVSPWATTRAILALLPPIAIFLGVMACDGAQRMRLLRLILSVGVASVLLEIGQNFQGPTSPLRFYQLTDVSAGVGFFANRSHNAALLYSMIPFVALSFVHSPSRETLKATALRLGLFVMLALGLLMTGARSAIVFGVVSFVLTILFVWRRGRRERSSSGGVTTRLVAAAALVSTVALAPSFGLTHMLVRFRGTEVGADDRWTVLRVSLKATEAFFPIGSGLGTFDRVYPLFETTDSILPAVVNHVHNDVVELVLELGPIALLLVVGWIAALAVTALRIAHERSSIARSERVAALIVLALLFAHSLIDYPVRTSAIAALFAFCCAIVSADAPSVRQIERRGSAQLVRSNVAIAR